ncbi:MAG: prepilin peptidase [Pedobacter sp.]|nr:prepilin peptidase [Pedobacter sp.]
MSTILAGLPPDASSIVLIGWAAVCGAQDIGRLRVSNVLTLGMLALALLVLLGSGHSMLGVSIGQAVLAFLLAMLLTLPGYALGKLGAADAKMLMALGLASTVMVVLEVFVVAGLVAAGLMLLTRYLDRYPWFVRATSSGLLLRLAPREGKSFPFAACMALGVITSLGSRLLF